MKNITFKLKGFYLLRFFLVVLLASGILLFNIPPVFSTDIPNPDQTITEDWKGTLELNNTRIPDKTEYTVKISNIVHNNSDTDYAAAIKISGDVTVTLIFEETNTLTANKDIIGAGIEVENGSTVNIYGSEGSSLTVTGGNYSAGIGGIGYNAASTKNPSCGNINIYSGNITAIGGDRGAGIGSGYHSSASDINIFGGNITALGTECAAGIGSGYGTSGGAAVNNSGNPTGSGVGFYNGGNINISGGTIRAASYHINFNNFNPYNIETLYSEGYSDSFAAGIGGGYGASSGNIVIEGNADVTALGACGGAGIGSGRGTSKAANYDSDNFNVNVTIKGNAKVIAMATDDKRTNVVGDDGGAAIGLGRGCTLEGELKGSVKIEENANVYAVAPDHAQAIGGSCVVGKFSQTNGVISRPANAQLETISVSPTATVVAISDGYRDAIQHKENDTDLPKFVSLDFTSKYFNDRGDFFTEGENKFPLKVDAVKADDTPAIATFAIQSPSKMNCMVNIPGAKVYNFRLPHHKADKAAENDNFIYLAIDNDESSAQFINAENKLTKYTPSNLTSRIDDLYEQSIADTKYGEIKSGISVDKGIFEYGSKFFCDPVNDQADINKLNSELDKKYSDKLERILYFDVGIESRDGTIKYKDLKGKNATIYVQIPDGWDKDEVRALFVNPSDDDDEDFKDTQRLETIDGVTYLVFETNHFSKYALFDPMIVPDNENNNEENKDNVDNKDNAENEINGDNNSNNTSDPESNKKPAKNNSNYFKFYSSLLTGDNTNLKIFILIVGLAVSILISIVLFRKLRKNN